MRVMVGVLLFLAACAAPQGVATSLPTVEPATASPSPSEEMDPVAATLAACDDAPEPTGEPVVLVIGASSSGFDTDLLEGPRHCEPFTIRFENSDELAAHNVSITLSSSILAQVFTAEPYVGPRTETYEIPALPAGEYQFVCSPHVATMKGTLIVAEA